MSVKLTKQETQVLYQCGYRQGVYPAGSFTSALIEAIMLADSSNRANLHEGFPELVDAVVAYQTSNLVERYNQYLEESTKGASANGVKAPRVTEPVKRAQGLQEFLDKVYGPASECIKDNVCFKCGQPATEFRDGLSKREFAISGLCQACQDIVFAEPDDWGWDGETND